ncbi:LytR/AlgR family response regulator transcription factor [Flavobacterium caeni]|uniref:Two component transcriptional regulator, LytTR family n=1 Tax=Flavobacterium caeni TaxID=490189 RepID=A0A1G5GAG3_9FLAO|nr:LytTR family DNA-binding domain-containing protein [Flavobacterium caeni]SCY48494.1 two component transcriptional regulator, LytTR family [Flavobacterium caeni]
MKTWKCLIVDDEDVDRLMVVSFAKRFPELEIVSACRSAAEALSVLERNTVDVLFLDVDMPGDNGLELRRKAALVPACVFITGHAEHAVETYELDTLDFIVKPLRFERFQKAMERVNEYLSVHEKAALFDLNFGQDSITIKEGHDQVRVNLSDIICLEALKDYTLLVTARKKYCVWSNLGALLKQPLFENFIRIHKSFAIKPQFVTRVTATEVELNGAYKVPVGRSYKDNAKTLL